MNANKALEAEIPAAAIPDARVVTATEANANRWRTKLWWLTAGCVLIAIGLVVASFRTQGTVLHIRFEEGHGLKAGDTLHFRGIDVGTVTKVVVADEMKGVEVSIQLRRAMKRLLWREASSGFSALDCGLGKSQAWRRCWARSMLAFYLGLIQVSPSETLSGSKLRSG